MGRDMHMFLFQGEAEVVGKLFHDPMAVIHPLTLLPLFGQLILLYTLFQKTPGKILTYIGLGCLSLLLLFITLVGALSLNYKIVLSTIPFILSGALTVINTRRNKKSSLDTAESV